MRRALPLLVFAIGCGGGAETGHELVGRDYYHLASGATCMTNASPPATVAAWSELIFSRDASDAIVFANVSACSDAVEPTQAFDASLFVIASDLSTVTYKGAVFTYGTKPPTN